MHYTRAELQKTVLSEQAYRSIRSAILTGKVAFGTQLVARELSESLGLSPTPIKSALTTLESEGLVISIPYRGFFVPNFDASDVLEIYSVREAIERKAARLAALHRSGGALERLEQVLERLEESADEGNPETHVDLDLTFHHLIAEMAHNQRLFDLAHSILGQAHLIIATSALSIGRYQAIQTEHTAIFRAVHEGNPDAAERAMWQHNRNACFALIDYYLAQEKGVVSSKFETTEAMLDFVPSKELSNRVAPVLPEKRLSDTQKDYLRDNLTEYIGPMAVFVCSDALEKADNLEEALSLMAMRIPDEDKAARFRAAARAKLGI